MMIIHYCESISTSGASSSRVSADGTGADVAAPAVAAPLDGSETSLDDTFVQHLARAKALSPFDLKPRHAWLCVDISDQAVEHDLLGWILLHLVVVVFGVLVVPHADKLLVAVRGGEDEGSHAEYVLCRDLAWVRGLTIELKRVDADGDWPDEAVVELLVEIDVTRAGDVDEAPFNIL